MIATKTVYKVPNNFESILNIPFGIWCSENYDYFDYLGYENISFEDARANSKYLNGNIIDESIKNCIIFTFHDATNYGLEKDKFVEIDYEELIKECEAIEIVVYE